MSKKPSYRIHDGFRMPLGFPPEGFQSARHYAPDAGDIFVATYPKCGTTWVQYIVWLLVRQRPIMGDEKLTTLFPHLEEVGADAVAALPSTRLIKTHLPFSMAPYSPAAKYILVVRNPFDCAVSFYHHTRGFPRHYRFADGDFKTFIECFIAGEVDFGDYFDHLVPWVEAATRDNVLLVRYESLRADAASGIRQIANFLGGVAAELAADSDALDWVVAESDIDSMRRRQSRWSSPRPREIPFVRRGSVGDWRDMFTAADAAQLAARFDARTHGTRAAGLWPKTLATARRLADSLED